MEWSGAQKGELSEVGFGEGVKQLRNRERIAMYTYIEVYHTAIAEVGRQVAHMQAGRQAGRQAGTYAQ